MLKFVSLFSNIGFSLMASLESDATRIIFQVLTYVVAVLGALAGIWGIWCAISMMRADNQEKRDAAKKRLIYTICGVVVAVMLIIILVFIRNNIEVWMGDEPFHM